MAGAPLGNNNAGKNKPWSDAIAKFMTQNPDKRDKIIAKLYSKAVEGDLAAAKEIFDRTEGKAPMDVNIAASLDLTGMPVSDLMSLFEQIRDAVDTPKA